MPKSLAEIQASQSSGLPERTYPICTAGKLVAQIEELEAQYEMVADQPRGNGRLAAKSEQKKIEDQIDALREEMNDHLVGVLFRAKPGHVWRAFVAEHPPRDGVAQDQRLGVNVDEVIKDLTEFIVSANGEQMPPGYWDWLISVAADGDLRGCVMVVADLHQRPVNIPKSLRPSPTSQEPSSD